MSNKIQAWQMGFRQALPLDLKEAYTAKRIKAWQHEIATECGVAGYDQMIYTPPPRPRQLSLFGDADE